MSPLINFAAAADALLFVVTLIVLLAAFGSTGAFDLAAPDHYTLLVLHYVQAVALALLLCTFVRNLRNVAAWFAIALGVGLLSLNGFILSERIRLLNVGATPEGWGALVLDILFTLTALAYFAAGVAGAANKMHNTQQASSSSSSSQYDQINDPFDPLLSRRD